MPYIPFTTQALIGWHNVFQFGTLSASSETSSGPAENAVDGLDWDYWEFDGTSGGDTLEVEFDLGVQRQANYLAIAAHDLGSQGLEISIEGSDDGSSWTMLGGPWAPETDAPHLWRFNQGFYHHFRVRIEGGPGQIGVLNVGKILVLPEGVFVGHRPETYNKRPKFSNNQAENGQFLGRSITRTGAVGSIKQDRVSQEFARTDWADFTEAAMLRPFFWAWRHDQYPEEVMYGWTEEGPQVEQGANGFMSVSVDVTGHVE
jgi:hypothetical protein